MKVLRDHWFFFLLLFFFLVLTVYLAANKPFWFDELCTFYIVKTGNISQIIELGGPMDPHPPLTYFFILLSHNLFGYSELASRLPSILFIAILLISTYYLVNKQFGKQNALLAIAVLLLSAAVPYAAEARPYAGCLAFTALTYHTWIEIKSGKAQLKMYLLLGILSACTVLTHFYAVLGLIPILLFDFIQLIKGHQKSYKEMLACVIGCLALLSQIPLMIEISSISKTHWSRPELPTLLVAIVNTCWPLLVLLLVASSDLKKFLNKAKVSSKWPSYYMAYIGLCSLVIYGFVLSLFSGAYHIRYVLPTLIGVAVFSAILFSLLHKRQKVIGLAIIVVIGLTKQYNSVHHIIVSNRNFLEMRLAEVKQLKDRPLLLSNPLEYFLVWHYAKENEKNNLYYVIDYSRNFNYKSSSADISLDGISKIQQGLKVMDNKDFGQNNPNFHIDVTPNLSLPRYSYLFKSRNLDKFSLGQTEYLSANRK